MVGLRCFAVREQPALLNSVATIHSEPLEQSSQPISAGSRSLRAELRPVKVAAEGAPQPRFAHAAAVLPSTDGASAEVVVFGGVNQQADLSDVLLSSV